MANRPRGYGLTAEINKKLADKYDLSLETDAKNWIEAVIGERLDMDEPGAEHFHRCLKDGSVLCKLIKVIEPGCIRKINDSKMAFKQMENIGNFLAACEAYGCNKVDMFQTVDLFEKTNMAQVVNGIHALGRKAQQKHFTGPSLGVKESDQNKREFTKEQLRGGESVIGLQAGSNQGASQAGMNFGKSRMIID